MNLGEVKDVVREHFGRIGWPTVMLDLALGSARREIEKNSNGGYYWMRSTKTFNSVASQQDYSITTATANGLNLPNFKDVRALRVKESGDTVWTDVSVGEVTQEEAETMFATDEENMPLIAIVDNTTLKLFPTPDAIYNFKLWHYEWTSNPTTNTGTTGTDELTERFPEALIYGALVWGCEQYEKSYPDADRWAAKFREQQSQLHRHSLERERQDRLTWVPMGGAFDFRRRTRLGRQIWV